MHHYWQYVIVVAAEVESRLVWVVNCALVHVQTLGPRDLPLICGLCAALYLAIGNPFLPNGPAWAIMLMWAVSSVCGWLFEKVPVLNFPGHNF